MLTGCNVAFDANQPALVRDRDQVRDAVFEEIALLALYFDVLRRLAKRTG